MRESRFIKRRYKKDTPELQLIPFIDILFVLLVFFMVTTNFSNVSDGMNVKLPKSDIKEITPSQEVVVTITKDKGIYVNGVKSSEETFSADISKEMQSKKKTNVVIRADEGLEYKMVVNVMSMSKNAGATEIDIATDENKN